MPKILTTYFVIATPRSGSTLLGQALNTSDLAGDPREHFGHRMGYWQERWNTPTLQGFVAQLMRERTTENGVFGAKLLYSHLEHLRQVAAGQPDLADAPFNDVLQQLFPNLHLLWITRDDKIRQAISYWKAKETGVWGRDQQRPGRAGRGHRQRVKEPRRTGKTAEYNPAGIAAMLATIEAEEAGIARFLADAPFPVLQVHYEELLADYPGTTVRILEYLGIELPETLDMGAPRTEQLADARTDEWFARFEEWQATEQGLNSTAS